MLAALEPAHRKGVIVPHPIAAHRFSFDHILVRDTIYEDLELAARGECHARVGHALERRSVARDPRGLGEIARHFSLAVPLDLESCVRHCRNAADAARDALGFGAAADLLSRACDALARQPGDERMQCELLATLCNDRFCAGDVHGAWRAIRQGAALSEQIGATDLFARFACWLSNWLELGGGDEDEARRFVDRAIREVGDGDSDLRASLLTYRAVMEFELPAGERLALLSEAEALAAIRSSPITVLEVAMGRVQVRDPTLIDESCSASDSYSATSKPELPGSLHTLRSNRMSGHPAKARNPPGLLSATCEPHSSGGDLGAASHCKAPAAFVGGHEEVPEITD